MTREEIIDTLRLYDTVSSAYNCDIVIEPAFDDIADTLLTKIEQEKKEIVECKDRTMQRLLEVQKREIFRAVHYELLGSGFSYIIKELAKEYGVEL